MGVFIITMNKTLVNIPGETLFADNMTFINGSINALTTAWLLDRLAMWNAGMNVIGARKKRPKLREII